jgi:hypothetical protein
MTVLLLFLPNRLLGCEAVMSYGERACYTTHTGGQLCTIDDPQLLLIDGVVPQLLLTALKVNVS